jgi:Rps23 Pro-64 3,4-dihydroxylase Tpa1-like proline 4-hydroxylase
MQLYKNFWSKKTLDFLKQKTDDFFADKLPLHLQYVRWKKYLWYDSGPILIHVIDKDLEDIKKELNKLSDMSKVKEMGVYLYFWLPGSYITWHDDINAKFISTTYLNKEWNRNWGGALLHHDEIDKEKVHVDFPEYNKMIVNDSKKKTLHATTIIAHSAHPRITLQIFCN